jgi:broad specificity phosphatase PhoE
MAEPILPLFYVCRHGRTDNNSKGNYRGWSNKADAQLSPSGREDARQAGLWLLDKKLQFEVAIVDDLDRTQETAKIVCGIIGTQHIITDKRARPLNVGDFTGKSKEKFPLESFIKDKNKVIPGGESINQFNKRQGGLFDNILETIEKTGKKLLFFGHGSNTSYLANAVRLNKNLPEVGYEGLVNPGGILQFTNVGIFPLTNKREGSVVEMPFKDGTLLAGFVDEKDNRPPRECWNCRNFVNQPTGGECNHSLVKIDPELQVRKVDNGNIAVGDRDCCDNFRNKVAS